MEFRGLMLAKKCTKLPEGPHYWYEPKLDGIRAYTLDGYMWSREGVRICKTGLPDGLDGELVGGEFGRLHVFDLWGSQEQLQYRRAQLVKIFEKIPKLQWASLVDHRFDPDYLVMKAKMGHIEGVMVKHAMSYYEPGQSDAWLKWKPKYAL